MAREPWASGEEKALIRAVPDGTCALRIRAARLLALRLAEGARKWVRASHGPAAGEVHGREVVGSGQGQEREQREPCLATQHKTRHSAPTDAGCACAGDANMETRGRVPQKMLKATEGKAYFLSRPSTRTLADEGGKQDVKP